jgi:prevent-host-death family protein
MDSLSREVSVRELRADLKDVLGSVAYGGRRIGVTRNGTLAAVIVSVEDLENLERYEIAAASPGIRRTRPTEMVTLNLVQLRREVAKRRAQPYPPTPDP